MRKLVKKKCKTLFLPTNDNIEIDQFYIEQNGYLLFSYQEIERKEDVTGYHLHIIFKDKVKIGDWITDGKTTPYKVNTLPNVEKAYKVIASTDKTLNVAKIPRDFISCYLDYYGIGEVLVDFNGSGSHTRKNKDINIYPVKDKSWTKTDCIKFPGKKTKPVYVVEVRSKHILYKEIFKTVEAAMENYHEVIELYKTIYEWRSAAVYPYRPIWGKRDRHNGHEECIIFKNIGIEEEDNMYYD